MSTTTKLHKWTFTERFYSHITKHVVLGVVESELGDTKVNLLLDRLTSWSLKALATQMNIVAHSWGWVRYPCEDHQGNFCPNFEHCWAIVEVKSLNMYIGLNVGREFWTVLTTNFHTIVHLCQYQCSTIISQKICKTSCKHCQD